MGQDMARLLSLRLKNESNETDMKDSKKGKNEWMNK